MRLVRLGASGTTRVDFLDLVPATILEAASSRVPGVALEPPVPNPASTSVQLVFSLPSPGPVKLSIHDVTGRLIRALVEGSGPEGRQAVRWDLGDGRGRRLPPGLYLVRLTASGSTMVRRLIVRP